jgi:hypothetical protein
VSSFSYSHIQNEPERFRLHNQTSSSKLSAFNPIAHNSASTESQVFNRDHLFTSCALIYARTDAKSHLNLPQGGLFKSLISQLPGFLNLSVLISIQAESEVLIIIFFASLETAIDATGSPMGAFLFALLERMSKQSRNLGLFTFPDITQPSADDDCPNSLL